MSGEQLPNNLTLAVVTKSEYHYVKFPMAGSVHFLDRGFRKDLLLRENLHRVR